MPNEPPQITPCPNCGAPWPPGAGVCPDCGFVRPGPAAWPTPPGPGVVTSVARGDLALGWTISFLSNLLAGVGFVVMPVLYFTLRRKYPVLARGIGFGFLAGLTVVLAGLVMLAVLITRAGLWSGPLSSCDTGK